MNPPDTLAELVHQLRPDWQKPGIRACIERALNNPGATLATVTRAAVTAAIDPQVRTPGLIPLNGPHWQGHTQAEAKTGPIEDHRELTTEHGRQIMEEILNTPCDDNDARRSMDMVFIGAPDDITNRAEYFRASIREAPERFRPTPQPPPIRAFIEEARERRKTIDPDDYARGARETLDAARQ